MFSSMPQWKGQQGTYSVDPGDSVLPPTYDAVERPRQEDLVLLWAGGEMVEATPLSITVFALCAEESRKRAAIAPYIVHRHSDEQLGVSVVQDRAEGVVVLVKVVWLSVGGE